MENHLPKKTCLSINQEIQTWNNASCAERVVASIWRIWTLRWSSAMYRAFLSFERAADCRFAIILHTIIFNKLNIYTHRHNIKTQVWFLDFTNYYQHFNQPSILGLVDPLVKLLASKAWTKASYTNAQWEGCIQTNI